MENQENKNTNIKKSVQTYIAIGDIETSMLEVDLVTFREKNQEMRYLSMSYAGINPKTGDPQEAFINIDNEEAFNILKNFFMQLEWNS
jgi:hypothetical protein